MKEPIIHSLFPTPVFFSSLERKLTPLETKFLNKKEKDTYNNQGNITSNDNYILNEKPFLNLKNELDLKVKEYFDKIICPLNKVKPYITQSWLNYTKRNQYHHRHQHPNSLVSGVFYINADEKLDKIKFFKEHTYSMIELSTNNYNTFNSTSWWFNVKTGDIVLFPSSLTHMVETKQGNNIRTSLAFNVFVEGKIGDNKDLTELIL
jgi:uncharacterized protein (TIGR02466 family)